MNDIEAVLVRARELGATFATGEGNKLKVRAPAPLPEELTEKLTKCKEGIIAFLHGGLKIEDLLHKTQPKATSPETMAASVLAGNHTDEIAGILAIWRQLFGIELDNKIVATQLEHIRQWQGKWMNGDGR